MRPLVVKNALSEETLAFINSIDEKWQKGGYSIIQQNSDKTTKIKNFLSNDRRCWRIGLKDYPDLLQELEILINKYNENDHKINLTKGNIDSHLLEYRAEDVGLLAEHQDVFYIDSDVRKLSMSIQINDGFEGGLFYVMGEEIPLEKNDAVIFPSFLPHGVKPVLKGNRQSLIVWAFGPHWQ